MTAVENAMSNCPSSNGSESPDVCTKVRPGCVFSRCDASSMLVVVSCSVYGYHFSKKFESAALWSGVTPTSTMVVSAVGCMVSMKAS